MRKAATILLAYWPSSSADPSACADFIEMRLDLLKFILGKLG